MSKKSVIKSVIALSLALVPATALARGGDVGNGGGAYICQDPHGRIKSALLLDLWEGQRDWKKQGLPYKIQKSNAPVETQIEQAMQKLMNSDPNLFAKVNAMLPIVRAHVDHLVGEDLPPPTDTDYTHYPHGCPLGGVAAFHDDTGVLEIQDEIVAAFTSRTDEAALYLHEALYKVLRERVGETTSIRTRKLVAKLFSDFPLKTAKKGVPSNAISCSNHLNEFYLFPIQGGYRAQFISLDGKELSSPAFADMADIGCLLSEQTGKFEEQDDYSRDFLGLYQNWKSGLESQCSFGFTVRGSVNRSFQVLPKFWGLTYSFDDENETPPRHHAFNANTQADVKMDRTTLNTLRAIGSKIDKSYFRDSARNIMRDTSQADGYNVSCGDASTPQYLEYLLEN
jgi:hypothetical protein